MDISTAFIKHENTPGGVMRLRDWVALKRLKIDSSLIASACIRCPNGANNPFLEAMAFKLRTLIGFFAQLPHLL